MWLSGYLLYQPAHISILCINIPNTCIKIVYHDSWFIYWCHPYACCLHGDTCFTSKCSLHTLVLNIHYLSSWTILHGRHYDVGCQTLKTGKLINRSSIRSAHQYFPLADGLKERAPSSWSLYVLLLPIFLLFPVFLSLSSLFSFHQPSTLSFSHNLYTTLYLTSVHL